VALLCAGLISPLTQWDQLDKSAAMEALLRPLVSAYPATDTDAPRPYPIDLPHTSRMYKTLLQGGHFSHSAGAITPAPRFSAPVFAAAFVRIVGRERTLQIARSTGAFVVAELLESINKKGEEAVREEVRGWFDGFGEDQDAGQGVKGWAVLMEKVRALQK
jgi:pumilio homology domain family member 6